MQAERRAVGGGSPSAAAMGPLGESWRAWIALAVGVLAVSAHSALSFGMSPLMKPMTDDLGWTRTEYAGAMNFRMALLMLVAPFAGQLIDRFGARLVLSAGALLMGIGTFGIASIRSIGQLYALNLVIGPGQACIGAVAGSALVLRLFRKRRGLAIGVLNGGDNFITSAVHVASASLLTQVGWRGSLTSLGAAYGVLAVLIFSVLRSNEGMAAAEPAEAGGDAGEEAGLGRDAGRSTRLRDLPWREPGLWLLLTAYVPIYAFITSVGIHFPAFQRDLGRGAEEAAWIYGMQNFVGAFGSVLWGGLAERFSARLGLTIAVAGLTASSFVLWASDGGVATYYAWAIGYGIANSGAVALLALVLNEIFGAHQIGRLMGVAMTFCMAGTIAGNFFAAGMFDHFHSYFAVWQCYTALLVATLVPAELLRRRRLAGLRRS